jgi:hypothetical protein
MESNEEQVSQEETSTPEYSPTPTSSPNGDGEGEANGEKISAYKKRMQELGREGIGAEIPVELADMMRAAAKQQGDIALTAWIRLAWADAVNAAGLIKKDEAGKDVAWTFDKASLEATQARTSTRGLSDAEKAKRKEEKQQEEKDQKSLVKRLLQEHRAKLKGLA